jgi:hypothetical protein
MLIILNWSSPIDFFPIYFNLVVFDFPVTAKANREAVIKRIASAGAATLYMVDLQARRVIAHPADRTQPAVNLMHPPFEFTVLRRAEPVGSLWYSKARPINWRRRHSLLTFL